MANKNFIVKNGLEVGGQEVVSSSGVVTSAALGGQTLASTDSPTFNNLTLTNDIAVGGDLNLTGDLNITGDVNTLSVTDLDVTDQTITLGAGQVESASGGSGIVVAGSGASILWDETNSEWDFNKSVNITTTSGNGITIDATQNTSIRLDSDNNTTGPFMIRVNSDEFHIRNQAQSGFNTGGSFIKYTESGSLQFLGDGLVVNSSDNVAIGHTDPDNRLHIKGTGVTGGIFVEDAGNSSVAPVIKVQGNRQDTNESQSFTGGLALSSLQTNALANDGKHIGTIYFGTNHTDGTAANIAYSASIAARLSGAANSATDMPTDLVFYTGSTGRTLGTSNQTYGTERLRIDASGNVGIGTDQPDTLLELRKDTATSGYGTYPTLSIRNDNATGYGAIHFQEGSTQRARLEVGNNSGNPYMGLYTTSGASGITIKGGNVGIGTNDPNRELELKATTPRFRITDADGGYSEISGSGGHLGFSADAGNTQGGTRITFDTDGSEQLRINSSGDVILANSATGAALIKGVSGDQTDRSSGGYPQYTFVGNEGTGIRRPAENILAFDAGGTENMRIHETGGLSIDTTNVPANTTGALVLANGGAGGPATTQPGGGLWIEDSTGTPKLTLYRASGEALRIDAQGDNDLIFDNTGSYGFAFIKSATTIFGIDDSASGIVSTTLPVGIGVTSILSGYKLEVGGSIVIPSASFLANRSSAGSNWGLIRGNDSGTTIIGDSQSLQIAAGGNVTAGGSPYDTEGNLICYGSGQNSLIIQTPDNTLDRGIAWRNSGGAYLANIYVTDAGSNLGDMVFGVSNATETDVTSVDERMRIDSSGVVHIGASTLFSGNTKLEVQYGLTVKHSTTIGQARNIYMDNNAGALKFYDGYNLAFLSSSGAWTDASDIAYKENIVDTEYGLDVVKLLQPRDYTLKSDSSSHTGFIAQELETHLPQFVDGDEGEKGVSYGQLTAVLTKAIQEQQTIIDDLKSRLDEAGL